MSFYFPIRLGLKRHNSAGRREENAQPQAYEVWREGTERSLTNYEELPEAQVLRAICHSAPARRLTFILGEPGAGKTTLFLDWFLRLAREAATEVRIGTKLPALVRMRSVSKATWNIEDDGKRADALWEHARKERAIFSPEDGRSLEQLYDLDARQARVFSPIWLFDGLDEVPNLNADERFYQKLVSLPGKKAVSVRTAVYQSLRDIAEIYRWKDHEILGLRPGEQQEFLAQALRRRGDRDADARSKSLIAEIRRNTAVRLLAGNPMMLGLVAELATDSEEALPLPGSRARFYAQSINRLWHRKLKDDRSALRARVERDRFLTEQAATMALGSLQASLPALAEDLERGLRNSGLLRVNDIDGTFEFLHLTFQEYYLAQHLRAAGLRTALGKHWTDARYEETLALLISLLFEEKRYQEIEEGVRWFVNWSIEAHRKDPNTLWKIGRSPIRTVLHILGRASISLNSRPFDGLLGYFWEVLIDGAKSNWTRETMAATLSGDSGNPPELIAQLADDDNTDVRLRIAMNASTPPELLARLADDDNEEVRVRVAVNPSTPPELLARLADDNEDYVRGNLAANASAPPELLAQLADDADSWVRCQLAKNASAPPELVARLADDDNSGTRERVAERKSAPPELLVRLADDHNSSVRRSVARNASTPPELLARLATDDDRLVRGGVARNASTPPELLARLATDDNTHIEMSLAENASTPPDMLERFAVHWDSWVRRSVAENANTPADVLAWLATSKYPYVRGCAAFNAATPPDVLVLLAADDDSHVRSRVAFNASTPPELLARLADDHNAKVRLRVAQNESTPSELLAQLAADEDTEVRSLVAWNARLLLEDLL